MLKVEGKEYEKLWLRTEYETLQKPFSNGISPVSLAYELEGISVGKNEWHFTVSDSIYNMSDNKIFTVKTDVDDRSQRHISQIMFSMPESSNGVSVLMFEENPMLIEGKYRGSFTDHGFKDFAYLLTDSFLMAPIFVYDVIDIKPMTGETSIEIFLNFPDFEKIPEENYGEELQRRVTYVKEHPNSKGLFNSFLSSMGYTSKNDQRMVFDHFSDEIKNTEEGKYFINYITKTILPCSLDTLSLMNSRTNQIEAVLDDSIPTLVIFSASWCGPCHAQIPLLKEIYDGLSSSLNFVYISSDQDKQMDVWRKLLDEKSIPWRSFFIGDKQDGLYEQYSITGIPHSILIFPGQPDKKIDVRIEADKKYLYNLFPEHQVK